MIKQAKIRLPQTKTMEKTDKTSYLHSCFNTQDAMWNQWHSQNISCLDIRKNILCDA
jgi:hypothetical protein